MTKTVHISTVLAFFLFFIAATPAFAFHVRVVEGDAAISKSGKTITITDTGNTPLILKGRLNIPTGTTVDIVGADVLLRSATHHATNILGDLFSNGDVVIVNPYGVYLGASANVNVAGLMVSTLNISNQSFINGTYQFTKVQGLDPAEILNAANITTAPGGYVVLLADRIVNKGTITAYMGSVALGSGSQATVSFDQGGLINLVVDKGLARQMTDSKGNPKAQIVNSGTITADGGKVEISAQLLQTALNDTVNNTGKIVATSVVNNAGEIDLTASGGINNSGTIDATNLTEQGETFVSSGMLDLGIGLFSNLDGAMNISGGIAGNYQDTGNIVFTGNVSLGNGTSLQADDTGLSAGGEIIMNGFSLTGNNYGLNLYASQSSDSYNDTLDGTISGVAQLGFYSSSSHNETFTSTGTTFSVDTVYTNGNALFSRTQGNGSMGTPYMVYSDSNAIGGLEYINTNATTLGYYYELANNINASETNSGIGFTPIGTSSAPFTGNFNGNSKTISSLYINNPSVSDQGLFGHISSATISNLNLSGENITGQNAVADLVGYSDSSTLTGDTTNGTVHGNNDVGGLVGYAESSTISSSDTTGSVTGTGDIAGGLIGYNSGGTISSDYTTGSVNGVDYVGGLVGYNTGSTISGSHVFGNITATATNSYAGGLVGENAASSTIETSYVGNNNNNTNTVSGKAYTGGLVGYNSSSTIETSFTSVFASVSGSEYVGGLVGYNFDGTLNQDYNFADVTASASNAGGIAGANSGAGIIENTFSLGTVTGSSSNSSDVGGLVGSNTGSTIEYSYATGNASGSSDVGGLIGGNSAASTVLDSFAIGVATSNSDSNATAGGLIGADTGGGNTDTNDWWYNSTNTYGNANNSITGNKASAQTDFLSSSQSVYSDWDISSSQSHIWAMSGNDDALPLLQFRYSTSVTDTYQLQLLFLGLSDTYTIENEIFAAESQGWNEGLGFEPIGSLGSPFTGTLNGGGNEIDDFQIDRPLASDVGLFSYTDGANINHIDLYNSSITGGDETGGLVGQDTAGSSVNSNYFQDSTINGGNYTGGVEGEADSGGTLDSNTYHNVTVSGTDDAGGILGAGTSTTVNGNSFNFDDGATIGGASYVGGIVGDCSTCAVNNNSVTTGHTDGSGSYVGGIAGYATAGTINNDSTNYDFSVSGGDYTGGIVGYSTATISESGDNGGSVNGGNYTGGVAGYSTGTITNGYANFSGVNGSSFGYVSGNFYVGGIAGYTSGNIENSEVGYGSVTGNSGDDYTGGVAGYNTGGTLYQDYADAPVNGGAYTGGLVGDNVGGSISQSYAIGSVSGSNQVGGLVGENESSSIIANSSAMGNATATGNNAGGLAGLNSSGSTIENSFAVGTVSAVNNAGGLVGDNVSASTVEDSFATGTATSTGDSNTTAGGLIGKDDSSNTNTNDWWYNATDTYGIGSTSTTGNKASSASVFLNPDQSVYSSWDIVTDKDVSHVWAMSPDNDVLPLLQFAYTTGVYDLYQLQMMFLNLGAGYNLENNIPASVSPNWNAYQGFVPIGGSSAFTGSFDGDGNTISNLTIDPSVSTQYVGLFGKTSGADIHNLTLSDVSVTGSEYVGAIAGDLISGTINDDATTNSSSVSGSSSDVGGLAGYGSASTIENSSSAGTVSGTAEVGGVVGYNTSDSISSDSSLTSDSSSSNVTGTGNNVGGLAGENDNAPISSSSATGTVSSTTGTNVGGLVGDNLNAHSTIGNSDAIGNVTGATMVGGLVGYNEADITSSYAQGLADGSGNDVGGLVGYNSSATVNNSYASGGATGVSYVGGLLGYNLDGEVYNSSYASGTLTASGSYAGGLIGENNGAEINTTHASTNVTVSGSGDYAGGLIGYNTGSSAIDSSDATGTVSAAGVSYVGGLIGYNSGTSPIEFSYATGDVTAASDDAGGLVGENDGNQIAYSYAQGNVTSSGNKVGGFIGYNLDASLIEIDHATGDVTASSSTDVGGFIGNNASSSAVMVDYATGNVSGGTNVGGFVGNNNGSGGLSYGYANGTVGGSSIVGGLVGLNSSASISNSYAAGDVTDSGAYAGGLVGENTAGTITNTYADGTVGGTAKVGGLIGYNLSSSSLINSFATGVATSSGDTAGALVGNDDNSNTFSNDWWFNATNPAAVGNSTSDTSLSSEVSKATSISDFYSTGQAVYNGTDPWDFIGIWKTTATDPELFFQYYNTWTNFDGNNDWSDAADWMNDSVPDSSTNVLFNFFNTNNSTNNSTGQVSSLVIDAAYTGTLSEDTGLTDTGIFNQYGGTYNANGQGTTVDGLATIGGGTYQASGNTQTFNGGLTVSGGTFTGSSGNVNATNVTFSSGTLTAPSATFDVSGAWDVTGGTFTPGGHTVTFDTSTAGETITPGGQAFSYVNFDPSGSGSYTLESALTAANNLTITSGTLNANAKAISVGGNWDNKATFTPDGDTVTFTSTSTGQTITSDGDDFYNVAFNGTGGSWILQDALTATNNLSISAGTLDTNSGNNYGITVGGDWTQTGGTFTPENGTVTFNGTGTQEFNSDGSSFYGITHSGSGTLQLTGSGLTVTHNLTNSAGAFDLNGENWTMTGANFSNNNGTLKLQDSETVTGLTMDSTHGSVVYDGTGNYTGLILGNAYNNLTFDGSGSWTLNNALTTNNNLTITDGTLNANGKAINVGGSWDNAGSFTSDGNTVTFTSTSAGQTITSGGDDFYNVGFNGTGGAWTLEDALTVDNNFIVTAGSFIPGTNTVTFDGSGTQQLNSGGSSFYGITHSGIGTLQLTGSGLTVTHNFTNSSGTFDLNGENWTMTGVSFSNNNGTVKAQGGETVTGLTMDSSHGNVIYDGAGSYTGLPLGNAYNNLTFNGSGSWGLLGALTINKDLNITNGTLNANGKDITVTGNWSNTGTFNAGGDTVTFDDSSHTINGNTTFANLTDIASGTTVLTFQAGSTQTITGDLTLEGSGLSLLSSSLGSSWFIDPQGVRTIENFKVQDSDNIDARGINTDGFNIVNLGHDINWFFPTGFIFPIEITQDGSGSSSSSPSNNVQIQTAGNNSYGGMIDTDDGQYVFIGNSDNSTPVVSTPSSNINQGYVNSQGNSPGTSWFNSLNSYIQSNWNIQIAEQALQGADGIIGLEPVAGTDNNLR